MTMLRFCARTILLAAPVTALLSSAACDKAQTFLTRVTASVKVVKVSPATAHIRLGGQAQLSALTETSANTPLPGRDVIWSSGNASVATVNDSGLVTAVAAGSATITATSEGNTGTSAITVDTGSSASTNEPPGMILISEQPWDCIGCNGWNYRADVGWSDIQTDAAAPKSPANVLRVVFPTTMPRDNGPSNQWLVLARPRHELYAAYWIKWGDPWDARNQGAKVSFVYAQSGSYIHAGRLGWRHPLVGERRAEWGLPECDLSRRCRLHAVRVSVYAAGDAAGPVIRLRGRHPCERQAVTSSDSCFPRTAIS